MKAFTFHDGELSKGIVTSSGDGKKQGRFVFLGEVGYNPVRLQLDQTSPPIINEDRMVMDVFPSITPASERAVLSRPQRESPTILLRINTSSPDPQSKRGGNWLQTGGRVEKVAYAKGRGWKDDIIKLQSGNAVIITVQGGNKYYISNYKNKVYCAEVNNIVNFKPFEEHAEKLSETNQVVHDEEVHDEEIPKEAVPVEASK